ncbi:homocysteine S-methyltransferase family protein [Bacillota bacterium]
MDVRQLLDKRIIVFDGAMGTMLQKAGLPTGQVPELFNFKHPDIIKDIYLQYLGAGSDIISTNTFGANRLKVKGCGYSVDEIVTRAVELAKEATAEYEREYGGRKYAALSLGPVGKLMAPTGDLEFEEACDLYREQILPGIKAGADLILIETQSDLYELKAAIVTAREITDIPLFSTVTYQEDGRMLMGSDPLAAVTMLQNLGVDGLGVNCSLGPGQMLPIVEKLLENSVLPVMVQPNAGLPSVVNGETVYNVDSQKYADYMEQMIRAGVSIVGGCCGTSPEYIKAVSERIKSIDDELVIQRAKELRRKAGRYAALCSATKTVILDDRVHVIGERINPTGKKLLKEALVAGDYNYIENEAVAQVKAGAEILDVNVGLPGIDEKEMMLAAIGRISAVTDAPLQIDSADPAVIEAAARHYNGRPIINSVNGKQEVMDAVFPIVKKYGTCVIALTLDEKGLPGSREERVNIAERIIREAEKYGIAQERILVDCLTLTVSAQQSAGNDTLEAMRQIKSKFNVRAALGASNVSFGLPERKLLNRTFLAMALSAGLDAPITDPLVDDYMDTIRAFETLAAKDTDSRNYIAYYGGSSGRIPDKLSDQDQGKAVKEVTAQNRGDILTDIIINGYADRAGKATMELLEHKAPLEIVESIIIPALELVGREYESGEKFLPQLVQSADAVKPAFEVLKGRMAKDGGSINYGKIVLATVKGDIHDIGKNIVKVLLENYGYEIIDLGRDTDIQLIVDTAKKENIQFVGLSALMTTTVVNMEATIKALKESGSSCKIAVGGAVLNEEYARSIGADYYCRDAMEGVRIANSIFRDKGGAMK